MEEIIEKNKRNFQINIFHLPGGPQRRRGLCSLSHVYRRVSCRIVSIVGMTKSLASTLLPSSSMDGTFTNHDSHSPSELTFYLKEQNCLLPLHNYILPQNQ